MATDAGCSVEAEIPLHVTGLWLPVWRPGLLESGSLGAGLLLEPPVRVRAEPCRLGGGCGLVVSTPEGVLRRLPSVAAEVYRLEPLAARARVVVESPAPLGRGYAVSAAVALAASLGLLVNEPWRGLEGAARLAHMAEVAAGTGLGDVVAALYGRGLELRLSPGGPGLARVESIPLSGEVVAVELGGVYETRVMHQSLSWRLHSLAAPRLARLLEKPSLGAFLEEARGFALEAGFVDEETAKALDEVVEAGLAAGWYAKKRVAVLVAAPGRAGELEAVLSSRGLRPRRLRLAEAPLRARLAC